MADSPSVMAIDLWGVYMKAWFQRPVSALTVEPAKFYETWTLLGPGKEPGENAPDSGKVTIDGVERWLAQRSDGGRRLGAGWRPVARRARSPFPRWPGDLGLHLAASALAGTTERGPNWQATVRLATVAMASIASAG